jgi:hypothetical protein
MMSEICVRHFLAYIMYRVKTEKHHGLNSKFDKSWPCMDVPTPGHALRPLDLIVNSLKHKLTIDFNSLRESHEFSDVDSHDVATRRHNIATVAAAAMSLAADTRLPFILRTCSRSCSSFSSATYTTTKTKIQLNCGCDAQNRTVKIMTAQPSLPPLLLEFSSSL